MNPLIEKLRAFAARMDELDALSGDSIGWRDLFAWLACIVALAFAIGCSPPPAVVPLAIPARVPAAIEAHYALLQIEKDESDNGGGDDYQPGVCPDCGGDGIVGDGNTAFSCRVCGGDGQISEADADRMRGEAGPGAVAADPLAAGGPLAHVVEDHEPAADPALPTPAAAEEPAIGWAASFRAARQLASQLNLPILIHFTADGGDCGPCIVWKSGAGSSPRAAEFVNQHCVPFRIAVPLEQRESGIGELAEFAIACGVKGYPTQVVGDSGWTAISAAFVPQPEPTEYLEQLQLMLLPFSKKP